jgi:hypothetical protein
VSLPAVHAPFSNSGRGLARRAGRLPCWTSKCWGPAAPDA